MQATVWEWLSNIAYYLGISWTIFNVIGLIIVLIIALFEKSEPDDGWYRSWARNGPRVFERLEQLEEGRRRREALVRARRVRRAWLLRRITKFLRQYWRT